jgi:hypothetical protein
MLEKKIHHVPVADRSKLLGTMTDRDIRLSACAGHGAVRATCSRRVARVSATGSMTIQDG